MRRLRRLWWRLLWWRLGGRLACISVVVLDVDGVLTDGGLWYGPQGELIKRFDVRDGLGIRLLQQAGLEVVFLSGGRGGATEVRAQQRQMGQSLLQLLADLGWPLGPGAPLLAWPAAFAWASLCLEIGSPAMEEAYLYSWVANQISAAVRLVPLGPTQGQRLQLALAALIAERAQDLAQRDPRQLHNGGAGAGLAQLQHAELYSRLFRS